jgi:hypothetical protein
MIRDFFECEMDDLKQTKADREQSQVRVFLDGRGILFTGLEPGPDPPDVIVRFGDLQSLAMEVTEYHPQHDRVGVEARSRQFHDLVDRLVQKRPHLKGVNIDLSFRDLRIPRLSLHQPIAADVVRFVEHAARVGWIRRERTEFWFDDHLQHGSMDQIAHDILGISRCDWPFLSKHFSRISLWLFPYDGYFPSQNYQASVAWCSPDAEAFRTLFQRKESDLRSAIRHERFRKRGEPLWLLVVCNVPGDLSSFAFRDNGLEETIRMTGFDFKNSVFNEFWLTDEAAGGRSQRLHPWDDQIHNARDPASGSG